MLKLDDSIATLRHLLAPPRCMLCRTPLASGLLCSGCEHDLPWNAPACPSCALPQKSTSSSASICAQCQKRSPPFDAAWAAFRFATPIRQSILDLKYHAGFMQARLLGEAMATQLAQRAAPLPELLLPVPLHTGRLRRRGYNQALELARVLAQRLDLDCDPRAVRRLRATADQIGQSAAARRRNLKGVFAVSPRVAGRRVALVDDVMTTGSTLAELARVCRKAGTASVEVWVAARTV